MNENQKKLAKVINRRLKEVDKFWNQACEDYQDLDEFLSSINALIQALRNITFILQSNKTLIPNFDIWYPKQQHIMKGSRLLKWLVDARNRVVKQGDLKVKSIAKVSIVNWKEQNFGEYDVDPLTKTENISMMIPLKVVEDIIQKLREPALKLERKWVVESLPDYEILNALADCYVNLKEVVKQAYLQAGIDEKSLDKILKYEKKSFILAKKVPDENRVIFFDLKDGARFSFKSMPLGFTDEQILEGSQRYNDEGGIPDIDGDTNDPFAFLEKIFSMAKKVLMVDGYHAQMVLLFFDEKAPQFLLIPAEDKTQQYLMIRRLAEMIYSHNVVGMIFILEHWISSFDYNGGKKGFPPDDPNKLEALGVTAIRSDGKYELRSQIFHKNDANEVVFDNLQIETDFSNAHWLAPILQAWGIKI